MCSAALGVAISLGTSSLPACAQNLSGADRAAIVLTTAKSAFNDQNYEAAAAQFREFLRQGAGTRADILSARYGLGVCLIEGPAKDYKGAVDSLGQPANVAKFKDRAFALYYLAVGYRGLAEQGEKDAAAPASPTKAGEAPPLQAGQAGAATPAQIARARRQADQNLTLAAANFGLAADAFAARAPKEIGAEKEVPVDWEWVARARCDQADLLLRLGQFKAAVTAASAIVDDPKLAKSRYHAQAVYELGYASFGLKNYASAVRSLSSLAPFDQGEIGVHARFLLGRAHHLAGERPEAVTDYQAVAAEWEKVLADARAKLGEQGVSAAEKERLNALLKSPAPDYVARAMFYWGVVLSEFGSADDAVAKFLAAVQLSPQSPIAAEARIRAAQSAVKVKKYHEAADAVTPLIDDGQWGLEALRYLAKAQYGIGTTPVPRGTGQAAILNAVPDPEALAAAIKLAIVTLQKAEDRARAMPVSGAKMPSSRAMILLDLGDMLQLDRRYADAAVAYANAAISTAPEIAEPALQRDAVALQLAGDFAAADKVCRDFLDRYPKSALRAEVTERYAENALLAAQKAPVAKPDTAKQVYSEATSRFNRVIEKFPDQPQANLARMGLATIQYVQGNYAGAAALLNKIPESDRVDDLLGVGFLLADCELRALPETVDDALSSSRAAAQLEAVTTQLESYIASKPNAPEAADAMIRVGYASVKLSNLLADPEEKRRTLAKARRAYVTLMQQFPNHPLYPIALLENAKILAQISGGAQTVLELSKFQVEPLNKTAIAPLAMIHLADAQRVRRQPEEAIAILSTMRAEHEAELLKDPQRAQWVPVMQYSLALSYKEAGKYDQARELFAKIATDFPKRPEALEAAWRIAQCQTDPALAEVAGNLKALAAASKPATQQDILATLLEANRKLRAATEQMGNQAAAIAAKVDDSDLPQKMNYDAAWCWRAVGDVEVEAARRSMQAQAVHEIMEKLAKEDPDHVVQPPRPPEIPLSKIPLQNGEKMARDKFKAVIEGNDSPLVDEARLELAEMYTQRDQADAAIDLLKQAIAKDPQAELAERLKIRLASIELTKGDAKAAAATAHEVLSLPRSSYAPYARAIAVEAAYRQKDWAAVIEGATPFFEATRGIGRMAGVSDHSILRMADAQAQQGKWQDARSTLETWLTRFPSDALTYQAKFTYGWICENLKDDDSAVKAYMEVAARNGGELGAKANLQVGRLRMQQNRPADALSPLLTVAYAYDDPELSPAAMVEAARAMVKLDKQPQARRLLERAIKEYGSSTWAAAAKKELAEIK